MCITNDSHLKIKELYIFVNRKAGDTNIMKERKISGFPQNVFVLSVISFFNDVGGETIKRAIPLYLANVLGVKTSVIGFIEGVAEATPQILQPVSGYISDRLKRRKPLIVAGQIFRSSMLFLVWATSWPMVLVLRFFDRSGKGISNAPRDALIASSSPKSQKGRSFGFSRALDDAGSVFGMILAAIIVGSSFVLTQNGFRSIVLLAVFPLFIALLLLVFFVRDAPVKPRRKRLVFHNSFPKKFYLFLVISFVFTLGNSSDAFLMLKAQLIGLPLYQVFLLLALLNFVSSVSGVPFSALSDRVGRKKLLVAGWGVYAIVYGILAQIDNARGMVTAIMLYGVYYGMTQGAAKALVADIVGERRRATAYGLYNMTTGLTLLPASYIAGFLWQTVTPDAAFYFGGVSAVIAATGLFFML